MGRKSVAGVETVGASLRIRFTWNKKRYCETLPYPATPAGIKAAAALRTQVIQLIKLGVFDQDKYAELFPRSRSKLQHTTPTFLEYAQIWLDSLKVTPGTRKKYKQLLNAHWIPAWAKTRIDQITPVDARKVFTANDWYSGNVANRALTVAKQVFNSAVVDGIIDNNPMRVLTQTPEPERDIDPFTVEERDKIIEWLYANSDPTYGAFFEFAFFTGMRITELLALRWADVDFASRTVTVRAILAEKQIHQRTKTKRVRTVRLLGRALHALQVMKPLSMMRSEFVFCPPITNQHLARDEGYFTNTELTRYNFKKALRKLGLRDRRQRDTRHTFATLALMAGAKPAFIAQQLGHSVRTLLRHYAKWINTVDDWAEVEKLENSYFGTDLVQDNSNNSKTAS